MRRVSALFLHGFLLLLKSRAISEWNSTDTPTSTPIPIPTPTSPPTHTPFQKPTISLAPTGSLFPIFRPTRYPTRAPSPFPSPRPTGTKTPTRAPILALTVVSNAEELQDAINKGFQFISFANDIILDSTIKIESSNYIGTSPTRTIDGRGFVVSGRGRVRCFTITDVKTNFIDIAIVHGYASAAFGNATDPQDESLNIENYGGGMLVADSAEVNCTRCVFSGNAAAIGGGAVHIGPPSGHPSKDYSVVRFLSSRLSNNTAFWEGSGCGGAIMVGDGVCLLEMTKSAMWNNSATKFGGAIHIDSSTAYFFESSIDRDSAQSGGGLSVLKGTLFLSGSSLSQNTAQFGGGLFAETATVTLTSTMITRCQSTLGGAIYLYSSALLKLSFCDLNLNTASNAGGALFAQYGCSARIESCRITRNSGVASGGGVSFSLGGFLTLQSSTLSSNVAQYDGGAIFSSGSTTECQRCNITGNTAGVHGGGLCLSGSSGSLVDSQIDSNLAQSGGGLSLMSSSHFDLGASATSGNTFLQNGATFDGGSIYSADSFLNIKSYVSFTNNSAGRDGGAVWMNNGLVTQESSTWMTFVENVAGKLSASGGSGGGVYISLADTEELVVVVLSNIHFEHNRASRRGGGLFLNLPVGSPKDGMLACESCGDDCRFIPINGTWREWDQNLRVSFSGVSFIRNSAIGPGAAGGALSATNGEIILELARFEGNFATTIGGAVYVPSAEHPVATTDLTFISSAFDGNFVKSGAGGIFYSETAGAVHFLNTTMHALAAASGTSEFEVTGGGNVTWVDSVLSCPTGYQISQLPVDASPFPVTPLPEWDNTDCTSDKGPCPDTLTSCWPPMLSQSISYYCDKCGINEYSLLQGRLEDAQLKEIECLAKCPYGGDCSLGGADIRASSGFYGNKKDGKTPKVVFVACPHGFCCEESGKDLCPWDSVCVGHRVGLLCGQCESGYTASLFGAGCIANAKCRQSNALLPWMVTIQAVGYAVLFYYLPTSGFASPFALAAFYNQIFNACTSLSTGKNSLDVLASGLAFLFGSSGSTNLIGGSGFCSWPGMQPLDIAFVPFMNIFAVFVVLIVAKVVTDAYRFGKDAARKYSRSTPSLSTALLSRDSVPLSVSVRSSTAGESMMVSRMAIAEMPGFLRHDLRLAVAAAPALNFSVATIFSAAYSLLTCTDAFPDSSSPKLLLDASISCYVWWQYFLFVLIAILTFFVSLPVIYILLNSSKNQNLMNIGESFRNFVNRNEALSHAAMLAAAPFKSSCKYWLCILIFQRISLGILNTTATISATARAIWAVIICGISLSAHSTLHPFKNPVHNSVQSMLLFCAWVVAVLNVVPATCLANAMSTTKKMNGIIERITVVESGLLFFPIGFVLLWQLFVVLKLDRKFLHFGFDAREVKRTHGNSHLKSVVGSPQSWSPLRDVNSSKASGDDSEEEKEDPDGDGFLGNAQPASLA